MSTYISNVGDYIRNSEFIDPFHISMRCSLLRDPCTGLVVVVAAILLAVAAVFVGCK